MRFEIWYLHAWSALNEARVLLDCWVYRRRGLNFVSRVMLAADDSRNATCDSLVRETSRRVSCQATRAVATQRFNVHTAGSQHL
jgi:hypothetical protein